MNKIICCAVYKGDSSNERGLRTMSFEIPGTGNKPIPIPISLLPSFAAGETTNRDAFEIGTNIYINGRLYPQNGIMYVVPTKPLFGVDKFQKENEVILAGGCGHLPKQNRPDVFNFGVMCQGVPQKNIGHTWQDSLPFWCESWNNDAERMKKMLFVGRQLGLAGVLRFSVWKDKNGNPCSQYTIKVRASQYSFFGKKQTEEDINNKVEPKKNHVSDNKEPVAEEVPF